MKKYIIIYALLFSLGILPALGQYQPTTVTTPRGESVDALIYTGQVYSTPEIIYWNWYFTYGYNCRILANSTPFYNCHGYAWHNIEGRMSQSDLRWIDDIDEYQNPIYNVTKYYSGGLKSYIEVGTITNHLKVSYFPSDHSAVTTEDQDSVISKFANGPLCKHPIAECPFYQNAEIKYYKLNPEINGTFTSALCGDQERTFTSNMSIPGSSYSWTKDNSRLDYVSGAGTTSYTAMAKTNVGGDAYLQLQITTPSGEVATSSYAYVWIGPPSIGYPQGPEGLPLGCITNYWINAQGYPTSYQWGMEGRILCQPGEQWYYLYGDNTSSATLFAGCQGRYIGVNVGNQCGTSYANKYVDIGYYDCEGGMKMMEDSTVKAINNMSKGILAIYPNPASNNVQVSVVQPLNSTKNSALSVASKVQSTYSVKVFNLYGTLVHVINKTVSPFNIPLNGLKDGNYIINVSDKINTFQGQLVIKH